jgi:hypothetical protein
LEHIVATMALVYRDSTVTWGHIFAKDTLDHIVVTVILDNIVQTMTFLTNSVAEEPEGSSPHSQQPTATGPYPEPTGSPSQSP